MVPFSFPQPLLKSRVMKERSLPSSPLIGAKQTTLHASHPVGQTCRFAPIKELPCLPRLPSKNFPELNPFPEIQPAPGILYFLSVPIGVHPWFKKDLGFKAILKGFKAI